MGLIRVSACSAVVALAVCANAAHAQEAVKFAGYPVGSIVVKTGDRRLFVVINSDRALSYPVAVGRTGKQWHGRTRVTRKIRKPTWVPPPAIRKSNPNLPRAIPPGPRNPLGAAILELGNGTYGIHGTNNPASIGLAASYGCIRMHNKDVLNLFRTVKLGTPVFVLK
jgi:lipoprotein-anchoring transpeptidase ErfK/SrfK